jgi:hypothetical protein
MDRSAKKSFKALAMAGPWRGSLVGDGEARLIREDYGLYAVARLYWQTIGAVPWNPEVVAGPGRPRVSGGTGRS